MGPEDRVRHVAGLVRAEAGTVLGGAGRDLLRAEVAQTSDLAATLQQHVKSRLAPYKYPRWIEFVTELPKTATGKIQRFKLRAMESK